jgi:hAT family C-terminal dimerisation region
MTTSLEQRFLKNDDMDAYAKAEHLLVSDSMSQQELQQKCNDCSGTFKDIDPSALSSELSMLSKCRSKNADIPVFQSVNDMMLFFSKRPLEYRALFTETIKLASLLTVVPATSATAERSFSCLKRVKTWLRTTMTQPHLNTYAILHAHRDVLPQMAVVMKDFVGLNEGRQRVFGLKFL